LAYLHRKASLNPSGIKLAFAIDYESVAQAGKIVHESLTADIVAASMSS